jgi:hypothetical protein
MKAFKLRAGALFAGSVLVSAVGLSAYQMQPVDGFKQSATGESSSSVAVDTLTPVPTVATDQVQGGGVAPRQTAAAVAASDTAVDTDPSNAFEPVNVHDMAQQANLIVVGRIEQVKGHRYLEIAHGMNDPNNMVAKMSIGRLKAQMFYVLDVDRVVKGDRSLAGRKLKWIDPNWAQNIRVDTVHGVTYRNETQNGIPQLNYGLFFLTKSKSQIGFVDKNHVVLPASPVPMAVVSNGSDVYQSVVEELVHVLETPLEVLSAKGGALGEESGGGVGGSYSLSRGEVLMRDAVAVLAQLPPEECEPSLRPLTSSDHSPLTRLWAFAGLVGKNNWTCFPSVQNLLMSPTENLHYVAGYPFELMKDKIQTEHGQSLLEALPTAELCALLKSTDVNIRQSVSFVLAHKKEQQLLDTLAQTADTDSDDTVRENCRSGLMMLSNIGVEVWQKEPLLAMKVAAGKGGVAPFEDSMCKGAVFEQSKMAESVGGRLRSNSIKASHYPQWVTDADAWVAARNTRNRPGDFVVHDGVSSGEPPQMWTWEGSEDTQGQRRAWYMLRKISNPNSDSDDTFVVRNTTVAFLIELKDGQYPEVSGDGLLPPAKILDVWQQDDDTIYKRKARDKVRIIKTTRIYGADGKPLRVSPAEREQTATIEDVEAN